ncbi:MAG: hypothetical protein KCHDKBKB_01431 [Elusimicrobia bacterium]|nr:hypothetical protein [Elusimicrobiota bacterium]
MPATSHPPLSDLQKWMRWVLTHPRGVTAALKQQHPLQHCLQVIGETPTVNRETRLSIYGNAYFARIVDALEANYSSVKNIVGTRPFNDWARKYLICYPSTFKSIDDVGHKFSHFLSQTPLNKKFPFVAELAKVEWAAHQSFFADDTPPLNTSLLNKIPKQKWPQLKLRFDPSVKLLKLSWPVDDLWRRDGKINRQQIKKIRRGTSHVVIYRLPDKQVRISRLSRIQFSFLSLLHSGRPLGKALDILSGMIQLNRRPGDLLAGAQVFPSVKTWIPARKNAGMTALKYSRLIDGNGRLTELFGLLRKQKERLRESDINAWFQEWSENGVITSLFF